MAETVTPEMRAALDAALGISGYPTMGTAPWSRFDCAIMAYRASIAPKECRPPSDAKDGSLWWLTNGERRVVGMWAATGHWKRLHDHGSSKDMAAEGWTVHSECIFPGEQVEATDEALDALISAYPDGRRISEIVRAALVRFKSPSLRSLSDAEIMSIANGLDLVDRPQKIFELARAVEAHIRGSAS